MPDETPQQERDAARRCADAVNNHLREQGESVVGRWVAVSLSDGSSDGVLYDQKKHAVKHQLHETQCAYICIPPGGMQVNEALSYLRTNRQLYAAGMRIIDPDKHVIPTVRSEGNGNPHGNAIPGPRHGF